MYILLDFFLCLHLLVYMHVYFYKNGALLSLFQYMICICTLPSYLKVFHVVEFLKMADRLPRCEYTVIYLKLYPY